MPECTLLPGPTIYPRSDLVPCFGYMGWRKEIDGTDGWAKESPAADSWTKKTSVADPWTKVI